MCRTAGINFAAQCHTPASCFVQECNRQHHAATHDHLQVGALAEERKIWADKVAGLERRFTSAEDENKRLRGENERLLDELRFLRSEVGHLDRKHKQAGVELVLPAPVECFDCDDKQPRSLTQ